MANIISNLYPPIMDTYNSAFIINGALTTCRIYFSISRYNGDNIGAVQVICQNQHTNQSVLKRRPNDPNDKNYYPAGIKVCPLKIEENKNEPNKKRYYVELNNGDLQEGFHNNQYYKVQLRFIANGTVDAQNPPLITDEWLSQHLSSFSEWSKVCLVRGISTPILNIENLKADRVNELKYSTLIVLGRLTFQDENEQDKLKSYRIKLYSETNELLYDSKDLYSNKYNRTNNINHTIEYMLNDGMSYRLNIEFLTVNLYKKSQDYSLFVQLDQSAELAVKNVIIANASEIGSLHITMEAKDLESYNGEVMFRRTSNESNFTIWEDVHEVSFLDRPLNYDWYDYTVKSGVWYLYCVQSIQKDVITNQIVKRGVITKAETPEMVMFEDMFLCANQKQLRLKYNPQITSFKKNVSESKIDTIGSQYPYICRNGAVSYRQFSLSGLITLHSDYKETFITKEDLYGSKNAARLYEIYNEKNNINDYNDIVYEREFREKVIDFLYSDDVKLLRTATEGNILIRLMDISFTPETSLGRMLYSFSATAYEVDDYSLAKLKEYNIHGGTIYISSGEIVNPGENLLKRDIQRFGQINESVPANKDVVQTILKKKYEFLNETGFTINIKYISKIRLEFQDKPYLIHENSLGELEPLPQDSIADDTTILGYLVYINNTLIYINPEGIYELNKNIEINSLYFPIESKVIIDYLAIIQKIETYEHATDIMNFSTSVGQLWGTFDYKESIIQRIWDKYYGDYKRFSQELLSVNGIKIEANPGTVFWLRDSYSKQLKRITINDSGLLSYYEDDAVIEGLYAYGVHLYPANNIDKQREILPENKYIDTGITVANLDDVKQPVINGIYTLASVKNNISLDVEEQDIPKTFADTYSFTFDDVSNETDKYIYYNGQWYPFTKNHDILCSVDAIIDYWCDIVRGVHLL